MSHHQRPSNHFKSRPHAARKRQGTVRGPRTPGPRLHREALLNRGVCSATSTRLPRYWSRSMSVMIVGAGGYIGRNLTAALAADGAEVIALSTANGTGINPVTGYLRE